MSSTELDHPPTETPPGEASEPAAGLLRRIAELESERDRLVAVVDILIEISGAAHYIEILRIVTRRLGQTFGLDRCSIVLIDDQRDARVMATTDQPGVTNLRVDLERYPELRRALQSGETVFIPDVHADPVMRGMGTVLALRNVRSIVVLPIQWRSTVIGAIFLRTERGASPFSEHDVQFCQAIAALTANALRNAHRKIEGSRKQEAGSSNS
jgi:GAF domain-containing protein